MASRARVPRCAVSFKWMDASGNIYIYIYISCGADWSHPFECPGFDYRGVSPRWRGSFSRCLLKSSGRGVVFRARFTPTRENFACSRRWRLHLPLQLFPTTTREKFNFYSSPNPYPPLINFSLLNRPEFPNFHRSSHPRRPPRLEGEERKTAGYLG